MKKSDLGTAIKCKSGSCRNYEEVSGCQINFKDINCKSDYVCYNEIQQPHFSDAEKGKYIRFHFTISGDIIHDGAQVINNQMKFLSIL